MKLDPSRSRIAIHTFAEGFLSALAHDLELEARDLEGDATGTTCSLEIATASLGVVGVVKRGKVDRAVLSAGDRDTIERQIRQEVLRSATVTARGVQDGRRAKIDVAVGTGRATFECDVTATTSAAEATARGEVDVSLRALGIAPVKGPMGAFRVSDRVRVTFELVFIA
jgi:hypothetical protein